MPNKDSITNSRSSRKTEAVKNSEVDFSEIYWNGFSDLPEVVILADSKLKILRTNRSKGIFSGLQNTYLNDLVPESVLSEIQKAKKALTDSSKVFSFNFSAVSGTKLYTALMVVSSANIGNKHNYLITLRETDSRPATDIKEPDSTYQKLNGYHDNIHAHEARLAMAMKIAKIAYWEVDIKTGEFVFNDDFYALFQTNAEKVGEYKLTCEKYLEQFVHPEDREMVRNAINASRENPNPADSYEMQHRIIYSNGLPGYMAIRLRVVQDKNGKVQSIIGANQDITEQYLAEEALRNSEAQLNNAIKIAKLGYWEYDVPTNTFLFNDQFYSLFRTSVEHVGSYEMTPEAYAKRFLHPDDQYLVAKETEEALTTTDPNYSKQVEHRIIREDGTTGYLQVRLFVRKDKSGKTIKTFGANQDITERIENVNKLREQNSRYITLNNKLKESLEQVQKINAELEEAKKRAEESDKLKSAFLANISHEIRTPMNGIIGFSKLLVKPSLQEERKKQYSLIVNDMCRQLLHLIDDIIDISKIETGQINIYKSRVDLNDILIRVYSIYKAHAANKNITLKLKKESEDEKLFLQTDNTKLRHVFENLLNNAIKFTKQGEISFGYKLMDKQLQFFVSDTGIGIAPEQKDYIFERFGQADNEHTKSYGGAGLGLAISKAYVEKLGGKLWYESELNRGTTFFFTLPYDTCPDVELAHSIKNTRSQKPEKPTILIVEDEDVNYLFLEEVLVEERLNLLHAKNGKQAVEMCRQHPEIDLILMDIKLPDISGYEAYKRILKIRPTLPALAQTAYALVGDREETIRHGFADYVAKPIDENILIQKINKLLTRK